MKKEYLIGLGVLAVVAYLYYDKKKKDQSKPYSDAELDKVLKDFTQKAIDYAKSKGATQGVKTYQQVYDSVKQIFDTAKKNGKDLSRKNVDKVLKLLFILSLNQEGDSSQGTYTKEDYDYIVDFMGMTASQGMTQSVPKEVVTTGQVVDLSELDGKTLTR
jgi:hypothetical protein